MKYDIQENSNETGITNMSDQVIRQELECKKGVSTLQKVEFCARMDRIMDYGQDRYEARDKAVLDRK